MSGLHPELAPMPNNRQAVPKVTKFGWVKTGAPSELVWINKNELKLDKSYQRETLNKSTVMEVSRNFNWIAFAALQVAMRDNQWFVIDGGHRLAGVMLRADIQQVPCLAYESKSVQGEAQIFLAINSNRRAVASVDRFRAELTAGDKAAEEVSKIITDSGFKVGTNGAKESIECVGSLLQAYRKDPGQFQRLWPTVLAIHAGGSRIRGKLVRALFQFDAEESGGLSRKAIDKLTLIGSETLAAELDREALRIGRASPVIWAGALRKLSNKRSITTPNVTNQECQP